MLWVVDSESGEWGEDSFKAEEEEGLPLEESEKSKRIIEEANRLTTTESAVTTAIDDGPSPKSSDADFTRSNELLLTDATTDATHGSNVSVAQASTTSTTTTTTAKQPSTNSRQGHGWKKWSRKNAKDITVEQLWNESCSAKTGNQNHKSVGSDHSATTSSAAPHDPGPPHGQQGAHAVCVPNLLGQGPGLPEINRNYSVPPLGGYTNKHNNSVLNSSQPSPPAIDPAAKALADSLETTLATYFPILLGRYESPPPTVSYACQVQGARPTAVWLNPFDHGIPFHYSEVAPPGLLTEGQPPGPEGFAFSSFSREHPEGQVLFYNSSSAPYRALWPPKDDGMDPDRGLPHLPLMKVKVTRLGKTRMCIGILCQHGVVDPYSMHALVRAWGEVHMGKTVLRKRVTPDILGDLRVRAVTQLPIDLGTCFDVGSSPDIDEDPTLTLGKEELSLDNSEILVEPAAIIALPCGKEVYLAPSDIDELWPRGDPSFRVRSVRLKPNQAPPPPEFYTILPQIIGTAVCRVHCRKEDLAKWKEEVMSRWSSVSGVSHASIDDVVSARTWRALVRLRLEQISRFAYSFADAMSTVARASDLRSRRKVAPTFMGNGVHQIWSQHTAVQQRSVAELAFLLRKDLIQQSRRAQARTRWVANQTTFGDRLVRARFSSEGLSFLINSWSFNWEDDISFGEGNVRTVCFDHGAHTPISAHIVSSGSDGGVWVYASGTDAAVRRFSKELLTND